MKNEKYLIIIMMLVITPFLTMSTTAHTPENMVLVYDFDTQVLDVTITHNTVDPNSHYIQQVDIDKNGVNFLSEMYTSQPTTSTFTYSYIVNTLDGDILTVTAFCSISGSIQRTLTVVGNQPPGAPIINGPTGGETGISYEYIFNAVDPNGDDVKYIIDWDDGNTDTTGLNPSGANVIVNHTWNQDGTFNIIVYAQDENGINGPQTTFEVVIGNQPPGVPNIDGPTSGKTGVTYNFILNAVDPEGDDVKYIINWDDENTDTTGLNPSGGDIIVSHSWNSKGSFMISVHAQDSNANNGPETGYVISIPKTRNYQFPLITKFFEGHQLMQSIIKKILSK